MAAYYGLVTDKLRWREIANAFIERFWAMTGNPELSWHGNSLRIRSYGTYLSD